MSDTGGYPLQRYPKAIEAEMDISLGRTSRAGQYLCDELDASPETRGPSAEYVDIFDAEDDRKMVMKYINAAADGKIWPSTRLCGHPPIARGHDVEYSLQERLFSYLFASAVNDTSATMGGPLCYWVNSIHICEPKLSMRGVRIAEEGSIHVLGNVQHSRLLPFHSRDLLCGPSQAFSPVDVPEDVSVFEDDEEFATEFGDPETEEWSGEFDETETF
ncbi:hypothetical protein LXA43DRAFT_359327 [Ganoderma leucocontextum]|nr:hypothetical protein LXA43DRAFT_359327 [Ganoderma leucocontextum]